MHSTQRYELNNPPMIAELVEGEVIAIDLERGSYYSLLGPAAQVWSAIVAGRSAQEILAAVVPTPAAGSLDVSLEGFLNALMAEQLIRPTVTQSRPAAQSSPAAPLAPWPAEALRFERFTDMQDLLTLDPIHEVDEEAGWPKPAG